MSDIPFQTSDWIMIEKTEHQGASGINMKTIFFFIALIITNFCYGQSEIETYLLKDVGDTYVADVKIMQSVFSGDCGCISYKEYSQCNLYEAFIALIRFVPNKSTVFDSLSLQSVRYFVGSSSELLTPDSLYTVTLSPGSARSYLKINNILKIDPSKKYQFSHNGPYLSSFVNCYKIGFFNELLLKLGLVKPEHINYTNKRKKNDKFDAFISNRQ